MYYILITFEKYIMQPDFINFDNLIVDRLFHNYNFLIIFMR